MMCSVAEKRQMKGPVPIYNVYSLKRKTKRHGNSLRKWEIVEKQLAFLTRMRGWVDVINFDVK